MSSCALLQVFKAMRHGITQVAVKMVSCVVRRCHAVHIIYSICTWHLCMVQSPIMPVHTSPDLGLCSVSPANEAMMFVSRRRMRARCS